MSDVRNVTMTMATDRADSKTAVRIGIDGREWFAGSSTGIARILTNLVAWGAANTGHAFVLFGNQHTEPRVQAAGVEIRIEPEGCAMIWDQIKLPRMLAEESIDVFFSPYYKGPMRAPCPVVVTVNDLIEVHHPLKPSRLRRKILTAWMKVMVARATRVLTLSEFSRADIETTLGVPDARVDVIPAGVGSQFFADPSPASRARARLRYALPERYVLYAGRGTPHKNPQTIIAAWKALPAALQEALPLVLVGADVDRLRAAAAGAGARDAIIPGHIEEEDLPAVYGSAAVFCFPSLYEGFGLPPLEAMASGVPVISSNAASMPEVLGDAALLVDPLDRQAWTRSLELLLESADRRADLVRRGRARAAMFSEQTTAARLLERIVAVARAARPR